MTEDEIQKKVKNKMHRDKRYKKRMQQATQEKSIDKIIQLIEDACGAILPTLINVVLAWIMKFFA